MPWNTAGWHDPGPSRVAFGASGLWPPAGESEIKYSRRPWPGTGRDGRWQPRAAQGRWQSIRLNFSLPQRPQRNMLIRTLGIFILLSTTGLASCQALIHAF